MAAKTAFQKNAFQHNAFQIIDITASNVLQLPVNCVMEMNQINYKESGSTFEGGPVRFKTITIMGRPDQ